MKPKPQPNKAQVNEAIQAAIEKERDEAFISLDLNRILGQLIFAGEYKLAFKSITDEKSFWASIHAVRLSAMALQPKDRKVSIDWMRKNGYQHWLEEKGIRN